MTDKPPHVGLFVTCLVDAFRPGVGWATVKLLQDAGCTIDVPRAQTCCGQPAYNTGDRKDTRDIALAVIEAFEAFDYVVAPSGSCTGMITKHYPALFDAGSAERERADALAAKTHELVSFLVDVLGVEAVTAQFDGSVTYHDSCSGLRELGIREQPRKLLQTVSRAGAQGDGRHRRLLRFRRHVLRQVSRHLQQDGHEQGRVRRSRRHRHACWPATSAA